MLISVITVTYNSEKTILDCIDSVSLQTYENIEHIIIDGKSSDNTIKKIKSITNSRIKKIISEKDNGIYHAMNKGLEIANGDIVGFLNSDDKFYSKFVVEKIIKSFEKNKQIMCCYGNLKYLRDKKTIRTWRSKKFKKGLFEKSWTPAHPTFYCKTSVYKKIGHYKTNYKIAADVEFMLRVLEINDFKSIFIDDFLVIMSTGGVSNKNLFSTITIISEVRRAFKENNLNFNFFKYIFYKILKTKELIN